MVEYHKINSVFMRDPATNYKTFLPEYSRLAFQYLANNEWIWTEKVDGTNIRVMWDGERVRFGGKSDNAQIHSHLLEALHDQFTADMFRAATPDAKDVCLYGEGYGAGIQKGGGRYRPDKGFILFDVKIGNWWLSGDNVQDIARTMGIRTCPVVGRGTLAEAVKFASDGFKSQISIDAGLDAEGIVLRPAVELLDRDGSRIITKLKTKDFH